MGDEKQIMVPTTLRKNMQKVFLLYGDHSSLVKWVNGTTNPYLLDTDKDSIYIPTDESAQIFFYDSPTDHPCQGSGSGCQNANIMPPGVYTMAAWVNGYSDQGETFGRTIQLGSVIVVS